jgi:hypothetical protein
LASRKLSRTALLQEYEKNGTGASTGESRNRTSKNDALDKIKKTKERKIGKILPEGDKNEKRQNEKGGHSRSPSITLQGAWHDR